MRSQSEQRIVGPGDAGEPDMQLDLFRLWRRSRRAKAEAREEADYLRRRHGFGALEAAQVKLSRPELTQWGRRVVRGAVKLLERKQG